jgi:hypothetical protein
VDEAPVYLEGTSARAGYQTETVAIPLRAVPNLVAKGLRQDAVKLLLVFGVE